MIRLIALLGNPGTQYARTRHNLPWIFADECALFEGCAWQSKFKGEITRIPGDVRVVKPATYMNVSGTSVSAAVRFFGYDARELLVVHDEVELPFGTVSFKDGGGTAGHNGLRSIRDKLGNGDFFRFRLGISRPKRGTVSSYVLARFAPEEEARLPDYLRGACRALAEFLDSSEPAEECRRGRIEILGEW